MKKLVASGLFLFLLLTVVCFQSCQKREQWVPLFNGKNLNDWTIKIKGCPPNENYKNTFRVEDGLLKVRYDQYQNFEGRFGHIFYKKPFSHYRLRVEYRFVGEQTPGGPGWAYRNSGIMIHGQTPESMELDQDFPVSIEVQLLGGNGRDNRPTLNVCTPGTNIVMNGQLILTHCVNSISKTYHGDQWVSAEVEVQGDSIIRHILDGKVVMAYSKPQLDDREPTYIKLLPSDKNNLLKGGTISLQSESHPVDFRKVEILDLDGTACP